MTRPAWITEGDPVVCFEALAPKAVRDRASEEGWKPARIARLRSYYFAILELTTLRGNGACLYNGMIAKFSAIGPSEQKVLREFLERIGLLHVETQRQNGGRISHRYRVLRVPYQGYTPDAVGQERGEAAELEDLDRRDRRLDPTGRDVEVNEVCSSEVSTSVDTSSEPASAKTRRPSDAALTGSCSSSVKKLNRAALLTEIQEHPNSPSMAGVDHLDVLVRAVELIQGGADFVQKVGGWAIVRAELDRVLRGPNGRVRLEDYQHLVRAALSMEWMPYGEGGSARLDRLISELASLARASQITWWRMDGQDDLPSRQSAEAVGDHAAS